MSKNLETLLKKKEDAFQEFEKKKSDIMKVESLLKELNYELNMITETILQIDTEIEKVLDKA